jgi:hypothetical protein
MMSVIVSVPIFSQYAKILIFSNVAIVRSMHKIIEIFIWFQHTIMANKI